MGGMSRSATDLTIGADWSPDMNNAPWSLEALEDLEWRLTQDELFHEESSRCREMITIFKAEREDPKYFARYGNEEQSLIISLINRFEGFC
jgi:hypothetical protein